MADIQRPQSPDVLQRLHIPAFQLDRGVRLIECGIGRTVGCQSVGSRKGYRPDKLDFRIFVRQFDHRPVAEVVMFRQGNFLRLRADGNHGFNIFR